MMRVRLVTFVVALMSLIAHGHAFSAEPTPAGLWQLVDDDTKEPIGWFLISDHSGVYDGIIAKMFLKPGEDPNAVCDQCKDDRHNHPWLGLEFIRGIRQMSADKYGDGTILNPRDGAVYNVTMKVAPDGRTLTVRGYIGVELLGQSQNWTRLPNSAYSVLDPAINPNPAVDAMHAPSARKSATMPTPENAAR